MIANSYVPLSSHGSLKSMSKQEIRNNNNNNQVKSGENNQKIMMNKSSKPTSSLDRRRMHNRNRQERDSKSRSAHSLQESSATSTTDYAIPENSSKGDPYINISSFIDVSNSDLYILALELTSYSSSSPFLVFVVVPSINTF